MTDGVSGRSAEPTRCGYVAIVGRPNVGKSTLLNHMLRVKLSITSRKPQTTRHRLLGVQNQGGDQIIYVDTPGIHAARDAGGMRAMKRRMVWTATSALRDVDVVLAVIDAKGIAPDDELVFEHIRRAPVPRLCLINKIDRLRDRKRLLPQIETLSRLELFEEIVPVSALKSEGLDRLQALIRARLPEGAHLFPDDQLTDRPQRFVVSEIVREKLMRRLGDEVPHRVTVVVEDFKAGAVTDIDAVIYVERPGQKAIVIGNKGERLKRIGQEARIEIERFLDERVMLRLWVKVKEGWTRSEPELRHLGYD